MVDSAAGPVGLPNTQSSDVHIYQNTTLHPSSQPPGNDRRSAAANEHPTAARQQAMRPPPTQAHQPRGPQSKYAPRPHLDDATPQPLRSEEPVRTGHLQSAADRLHAKQGSSRVRSQQRSADLRDSRCAVCVRGETWMATLTHRHLRAARGRHGDGGVCDLGALGVGKCWAWIVMYCVLVARLLEL